MERKLEVHNNTAFKTSKLSLKRVLDFASTDTAGNLLYCTLTSYIMYFYTDVLGISVAAAGVIYYSEYNLGQKNLTSISL